METYERRRERIMQQNQLLEQRHKEVEADRQRALKSKAAVTAKTAKADLELENMMPAERRAHLERTSGNSQERMNRAPKNEENWGKKENLVVTIYQETNQKQPVHSRLGVRRDVSKSEKRGKESLSRNRRAPPIKQEIDDGDIFENVVNLTGSAKAALLALAAKPHEDDSEPEEAPLSTCDLNSMSEAQSFAQCAPKHNDRYEAVISEKMHNMNFVPYMGETPPPPTADYPTGSAYLPQSQVYVPYMPEFDLTNNMPSRNVMENPTYQASTTPNFVATATHSSSHPSQPLPNRQMNNKYAASYGSAGHQPIRSLSPGINPSFSHPVPPANNPNFVAQGPVRPVSPAANIVNYHPLPTYPNSVSPSLNDMYFQGPSSQTPRLGAPELNAYPSQTPNLRSTSPAIANPGFAFMHGVDFSVPPPSMAAPSIPNVPAYKPLREGPHHFPSDASVRRTVYQENDMYHTPPHAPPGFIPGNVMYEDVVSPDQAHVAGSSPYVPPPRPADEPMMNIGGTQMPQSQAEQLVAQALAMAGGGSYQYQDSYQPKPSSGNKGLRPLLGRSDGDQTPAQEYNRAVPSHDTSRNYVPHSAIPINHWEGPSSATFNTSEVRREPIETWEPSSDDGHGHSYASEEIASEPPKKWEFDPTAVSSKSWGSLSKTKVLEDTSSEEPASESNDSAWEKSSTQSSKRWEDMLDEDFSEPLPVPVPVRKPKEAAPPQRKSKLYERMERARNDNSKRHSRTHLMSQMKAPTWDLTYNGRTMTVTKDTPAGEIRAMASSTTSSE